MFLITPAHYAIESILPTNKIVLTLKLAFLHALSSTRLIRFRTFVGQYFDSTEVYNIETNSWSMLSSRIPISVKNVGLCYVFDVEKVCS